MSSTTKTLIGIVVLIAVLGAYYWYVQSHATVTPSGAESAQTTTTTNTSTSQVTSNDSVIQDSAAIDAQLSNLNADNASMNSSDQAVTQSY